MIKHIYSLMFPILTVITGIVWAFNDFIIPAMLMIACSLVSIILTLLLKIDTNRYLKLRIIFFALSLVTFVIPLMLFNRLQSATMLNAFFAWIMIAPFITFMAELIVCAKLQLFKEPKTLTTILLSDPLACNLIVLIYTLIAWWIHGV